MNLYKSLIMEIRPRLQSVNVFVTLDTNTKDIRVNLKVDCFEIVVGSSKQTVRCEQFRILPASLACFLVEGDWVSFRFSTDNLTQDLGSSRFEIVKVVRDSYGSDSADVEIKAGMSYDICCANCARVFCKKVAFKRVLPLPESSDSSDWFCHAHGDPSNNIVPKSMDALYSHCFVYVNEELLTGFAKADSNLICVRCLSWVGIAKPGVHKLWFNTVLFSSENESFKSDALDDAFVAIKQVLNSSLASSSRIILSCQSSRLQTDFVLLWVVEKRLKVRFEFDQSTSIADMAKVLFTFDKYRSDLVSRWLNDVNVNAVEVSKPMMLKLLEHLYGMNRRIPNCFSISNDFYVSYLTMYKDNE